MPLFQLKTTLSTIKAPGQARQTPRLLSTTAARAMKEKPGPVNQAIHDFIKKLR